MGRVKKYSTGTKHRRSKSLLKKKILKSADKSDNDDQMVDDSDMAKSSASHLSVNKRKQIFKKSKDGRRELKKQILELKRQSSKLRKRNLGQKTEKKRIAKEIKSIRENMRKCGMNDEELEEAEENQSGGEDQ